MRHRLKLYRRTQAASDFAPSDEATELVAEVFAEIKPQGGSETEQASQQVGLERFMVTTRWGSSIAAINASWWGVWTDAAAERDVRLNFVSVRNKDGRYRTLEIEAVASDG